MIAPGGASPILNDPGANGHAPGPGTAVTSASPTLVLDSTTPPIATLGAPITTPFAAPVPVARGAAPDVVKIPVATPPPRASSPRTRVGVLVALGVVLVGGTALGSFLYLRKTPASPDESASSAPKPSKKGKRPAASATAASSADPMVEDTPPPTMQADSATTDPGAASAAPSTSTAPHSKPRVGPLRRVPVLKR